MPRRRRNGICNLFLRETGSAGHDGLGDSSSNVTRAAGDGILPGLHMRRCLSRQQHKSERGEAQEYKRMLKDRSEMLLLKIRHESDESTCLPKAQECGFQPKARL